MVDDGLLGTHRQELRRGTVVLACLLALRAPEYGYALLKRLVEADEVASLAGWLVSDKSGMVTGASYTMDGGWTAR